MNNCQRILVVIVHYFNPNGDGTIGSLRNEPSNRAEALGRTITSLHDLFNDHTISLDYRSTYIPRPANIDLCYTLDVMVLTTRGMTVFDHLAIDQALFKIVATDVEPTMLGFEANQIFKDYANDYDRYVFLEDDIILHDPLFFIKLDWFEDMVGSHALLQPHLYEVTERDGRGKVYIDGDFVPDQVARYRRISGKSAKVIETEQLGQQLRFCYAPNPHSGCYFISQAQLHFWLQQPWYLDRDTGFVRSFESAASLGILKTFDIYKAELNCAAFLEVQHFDEALLAEVIPPSGDALSHNTPHGRKKNQELRLAELEAEVKRLKIELKEYQTTPILLKNTRLEGEIKHLDGVIRDKTAHTKQLEETLHQQTKSAISKPAQLEGKIKHLYSVLRYKTAHTVQLEEAIHQQITSATSKQTQLEGKIKHLDGVIRDKTAHTKQLEEIIHQQTKSATSKQAQLELDIHHLENAITKIQNSKSWYLTAPLRYLNRKFRQ